MEKIQFKELLCSKKIETENIIYRYLPKEEGLYRTVTEAMNYSVRAGGKRLRPMLLKETAELFGYTGEETHPFMAAIEFIHTYSLVHDDLPAMDNDELRRGMPTTHIKFGHAMGVLAGDGLLNYAFELLTKAVMESRIQRQAACAAALLAEKSGVKGMLGGQAVDVEKSGQAIDRETLDFIYRLKTGALIEGAMMSGAIIGGASGEAVKQVQKVALAVGMAFQIQDDILDVESTEQELGKPVFSDEKNQKTTYVTLYGVEKAKEQVEIYTKQSLEMFDGLGRENEFLRELLISLVTRKN